MSLDPDAYHVYARAVVRTLIDERHWLHDELVSAVVERFCQLAERGTLNTRPTMLGSIARNAAVDELRRLGSSKRAHAGGHLHPVSLDALGVAGTSFDWPDEAAHDFPDRIADQILAATRAGQIMGSLLTSRERRVVRLRASGMTLAAIGERMGLDESRIHQILGEILQKVEPRTT